MKRRIALYSSDGIHLVRIRTNGTQKRLLFNAALQRIVQLNTIASKEQLFPWLALLDIEQKCTLTSEAFDRTAAQYHTLFDMRKISWKDYQHQPQTQRVYSADHVLQHQLLELLVQYDHLSCQAQLLFQTKGFTDHAAYFQKKDQEKVLFLTLLTQIVQYRTRAMAAVHLEDFIEDTPPYRRIAAQFGAIKPQLLYRALQSTATPPLSAKRQNTLIHQLRQKWPNMALDISA